MKVLFLNLWKYELWRNRVLSLPSLGAACSQRREKAAKLQKSCTVARKRCKSCNKVAKELGRTVFCLFCILHCSLFLPRTHQPTSSLQPRSDISHAVEVIGKMIIHLQLFGLMTMMMTRSPEGWFIQRCGITMEFHICHYLIWILPPICKLTPHMSVLTVRGWSKWLSWSSSSHNRLTIILENVLVLENRILAADPPLQLEIRQTTRKWKKGSGEHQGRGDAWKLKLYPRA